MLLLFMKRTPSKTQQTKGGIYNGLGRRRNTTSTKQKKEKQKEQRLKKMKKKQLRATQDLLDHQQKQKSIQLANDKLHAPRVAIVGGGPAGLASLRSLLAYGCNVTLFERSETVGGLWKYEPKKSKRPQAEYEGDALYRQLEKLPTGEDVPIEDRIQMDRNWQKYGHLSHSEHLDTMIPGEFFISILSSTLRLNW